MASKPENLPSRPPSKTTGSAVSILDWDEGSPSAPGRFGVAIRYAPSSLDRRGSYPRARLRLPLENDPLSKVAPH